MSIVKALPHWDMTVVYPSMESKEFAEGFSRVVLDIDDLANLFDTHHIMKQPSAPALNRWVRSTPLRWRSLRKPSSAMIS